jgi:hypothetical protein
MLLRAETPKGDASGQAAFPASSPVQTISQPASTPTPLAILASSASNMVVPDGHPAVEPGASMCPFALIQAALESPQNTLGNFE